MLKKIMLGIVATVMLIGAENLIAQETQDRPKAEPKQKQARQRAGGQALEGRQRQKDRAQQPRRQRADREAVRERMENLRGEPEPVRPGQDQLAAQSGQMFGRWLDELTNAYRADDREKMGQLLRKMHQLRQKWQRVKGRGFQGRGFDRQGPGIPQPPFMEKPEQDEDVDRPGPPMPPRGMGGWGQGFQGRGMIGGWGRGWQGRGMGGWCRGFQGRGMTGEWGRGWQGRGMGRWGQGFQGRGMIGGWGRGFRSRGFDRQGPGMQPPLMEKPELDEDVDRPGPPMPHRGMGGWGQGFQGRGMIGGWGRGFRSRGFDRQGPGMQPPLMEKPELDEDVNRPGPPMPPRGMGGWGQRPSEQ